MIPANIHPDFAREQAIAWQRDAAQWHERIEAGFYPADELDAAQQNRAIYYRIARDYAECAA